MSSRKQRKKQAAQKPSKSAAVEPAPIDLASDPPAGVSIDAALEANAPHDVAILETDSADEPMPETQSPEDLQTLELPAGDAETWERIDPEATVDLRGPADVGQPVRDDAPEPERETALEPGAELDETVEAAAAADVPSDEAETTEAPALLDAEIEPASDAPAAAEDESADSITTSATDRERRNLKGLVEALVFATDKPIKVGELARLTDATPKLVRTLLAELGEDYKPRGIQLSEVGGGYLFRTNVRYGSYVRELTQQKPIRLSRAQLEALAILAYRQPITRPEIDEIRGVDSGPVLKMLLERELVRILGKRDEVGRPIIYGTTPEFLEFFGLKSLKDLPNLREFTELTDESHAIAEKELGESWRGPEQAASDPNDVIDVPIPTEEEQAALDAEAAQIAIDSAVEHVLIEEEPVFEEPSEAEPEALEEAEAGEHVPAAEEPAAEQPEAEEPEPTEAEEPAAEEPEPTEADEPAAEEPALEQPEPEQPEAEQPEAEEPEPTESEEPEPTESEEPEPTEAEAEEPEPIEAEEPEPTEPEAEEPEPTEPTEEP